MEIETKNASLDTMAVTINALHVSGKQMTLAVFRQLPTATETDKSDLWGIVRYTIKDNGDIWLVFSESGRLFRRALNLSNPRRLDWELIRDEIKFNAAMVALDLSDAGYIARGQDLFSYNVTRRIELGKAELRLLKDRSEVEHDFNEAMLHYNMEVSHSRRQQLFIAV